MTLAVNNTTSASRTTASIVSCLHRLVTPGTEGPLDEVVVHVGASAASMHTLKDGITTLLGFFMALENNYNMKVALLSHGGGGHFPSTLPIRTASPPRHDVDTKLEVLSAQVGDVHQLLRGSGFKTMGCDFKSSADVTVFCRKYLPS